MESTVEQKIKRNKQITNDAFRVIIVIVSSIIYSLAVIWFLEPANLVSIGATAIGQILHQLLPKIPIGVFTLLINIPLCIYGFKYVSPRFIIYTMLSVAIQSIMLLGWIPQVDFGINPETDKLFLSIIAALFAGVGMGLALKYGTSTGGVDVVSQALTLKKGNISLGSFNMVVNVFLAIIYGGLMNDNWAITLYTFIFIIISNLVIDRLHTGYNYLKLEVITKNKEEVSKALLEGIKRGCTTYNVEGAYTRETKYDVFMVISSYELERAKRIIYQVDPHAFIMVLPVNRIIGAFFKHTII